MRAPDANGWLDICSAPKDGAEFIAFQGGDIYRCAWLTEEPDEGPPHTGWWDFVNSSFEEPTHWIPLPKPPVAAS